MQAERQTGTLIAIVCTTTGSKIIYSCDDSKYAVWQFRT